MHLSSYTQLVQLAPEFYTDLVQARPLGQELKDWFLGAQTCDFAGRQAYLALADVWYGEEEEEDLYSEFEGE